MALMSLRFLVCLLTVATTVVASSFRSQNHLVMPRSSDSEMENTSGSFSCLSWRLAYESNNLPFPQLIPMECKNYVANYMLKGQYEKDCDFLTDAASQYAETLTVAEDGKDIWVFDIDETTLSNVPVWAEYGFGSMPINVTRLNEWMASGKAEAIPGALRLYKKLVSQGFKIVFLSSADISIYEQRAQNLKRVGYTTWEKLILKDDPTESSFGYKARNGQELEDEGYRIRGNGGDQWTDIQGNSVGDRQYKFPNPMYYVA